MTKRIPVVLIIMDGWGYAPPWGGNAISVANTPNVDGLWKKYPHALLEASGEFVGLPGHEWGNSEVGHLNLGSGRIPLQDSTRIEASIKDGSFFNNPTLIKAFAHCKKHSSDMHLMGLISDANIHSNIKILYSILELAKKQNFDRVFIHAFSDGRDSDPMSALKMFSDLIDEIKKIKIGEIATVCGRFWAMDRDNHWDRIELAYNLLTKSIGTKSENVLSAISASYNQGKTDEFIHPIVITKNNKPVASINNNDSIIFFNFRSDRARQISTAFMSEKFEFFPRKTIKNLFFVGMIPYGYEAELKLKLESAFNPGQIKNTLAEVLSINNKSQFHIAETEKYAHVTYFFNGGKEEPFQNEDRELIASPRIESYAEAPEMSAKKVAKEVIEKIKSNKYDFIVANFANPDMVGHTGNFSATIRACEEVDTQVGNISKILLEKNGIGFITADHGNAEEMINIKTGEVNNEHTNNPVPFILVANDDFIKNVNNIKEGVLSDISPTILEIMKIKTPSEMTGNNLIIYK